MLMDNNRLQCVDTFRGFAVIAMILVNFLAYYTLVPLWLKHSTEPTITFADLVAPMFLFALGIMYRISLLRRLSLYGRKATYLHFFRRYFLLLLLGMVGGSVAKMDFTLDWGVLQAIGLAGIIALPFIELSLRLRLFVIALLLGSYHFIILTHVGDLIISSEHGGPLATISWATIILFASMIGDLLKQPTLTETLKKISLLTLLPLTIGLLLTQTIALEKTTVSVSYIFLSTGIVSLLFVLFIVMNDLLKMTIPFLASFGKNALVVFLLHYLLVKIAHKLTQTTDPIWIVLLGLLSILFISFLIAYFLEYKKLYLKL